MDDLDRASELEEKLRQQALLLRKPQQPQPCGWCNFCGTPLPPGLAFCEPVSKDDAGCLRDWQIREDAKQRNGT